MLHQFDSNALAHQKLNLQYFQQQQQQGQQHQHPHQPAVETPSIKPIVVPGPSSGHEPRFSQHSCGSNHDHHHAEGDFSNIPPPSPLMLQPTILPSQPLPPSSHLSHSSMQPLELHPHLMYHQRSVFEMQHAYQQHHHTLQQQQQQQQMDQQFDQQSVTGERGRKGAIDIGYHRKRSLSVPLLLSTNQQERKSNENGERKLPASIAARQQQRQQQFQGRDHDGDQDMDAHNAPPEDSTSKTNQSNRRFNGPIDYSNMVLPRETLLATVPRTYSHRVYAGHGVYQYNSNNHHNTLYYNHSNINAHHHYTVRSRHLHYNPFLNRKFPPYKYWAVSAQRDYHLSRIGVLVGRAGTSSASSTVSNTLGLSATSSSTASGSTGGGPPPGAGGDLVLRTGLGAGGGGGVSKTHYRSRLPVHLRHMTSRTNRRPAICGNPFQEDAHAKQLVSDSKVGMGTLPPSENELPSSSPCSSSASAPAHASTELGRRRLSWKRVTALGLDLENDQRGGMVMRMANQDRVTPVGGISRHWMSQRGGLANLMQPGSGSGSAAAIGGEAASGVNTSSTVDRLVEEMNKWSV